MAKPILSDTIADVQVCRCAQGILNNSKFNIALVDAIHVASAIMNGIPILLTYDGTRQDKKKDTTPILDLSYFFHLRDNVTLPTLIIQTPEAYLNNLLPEGDLFKKK